MKPSYIQPKMSSEGEIMYVNLEGWRGVLVLLNKEKINNKIEPSYIQHSMQKTLVPRSSMVECVGQVKTI